MSDTSKIHPVLEQIPEKWKDLSKKSKDGDGKNDVAFALGGLGGFNNYLGGFLASAIELKSRPSLISCTSGGIAWTAEYLRAINKSNPAEGVEHLRSCAKKADQQSNPLGKEFRLLNDAILGLTGIPNIFRPQWEKTIPNFFLHGGLPDRLPRALTGLNGFALVLGSGGSTTACGSCWHRTLLLSQPWSEIVCGRLRCGHRPLP